MLTSETSIQRTTNFFTVLYSVIAIVLFVGSIYLLALWGTDVDDLFVAVSRSLISYAIPLILMALIYWVASSFNLQNILFIPLIVISGVVPGVIGFYFSESQGAELIDFLPLEILLFAPIFIIQKIGRGGSLRKEETIENFSLKLKIIGILLLFLPILSYQVANVVSDLIITKKISDRENRENKRIVTVSDVSDELVYTTKGNPIGIKISYDVNFLSYYFGDDAVDLEKLNFGFDPIESVDGDYDFCPHPMLSSKTPNILEHVPYTVTEELLTNKKTYHITEYLLPCRLRTESNSSQFIDLGNSCFEPVNTRNVWEEQFVKRMSNISKKGHFSGKIQTPSPLNWPEAPSVVTDAEYSIGTFFYTMDLESVRDCTASDSDLIRGYYI